MAVVGWILGIVLLLIVAALVCPLRVLTDYVDTWHVEVRLFGVIPVFRMSGKDAKPSKSQKASPSASEATETTPKKSSSKTSIRDDLKALYAQEGVGGVLHFFKQFAVLLGGTLKRLVRCLTLRKIALCVRIGGEEADTIAVRYGQISAAFSNALTLLEMVLPCQNRCVRIVPDFLTETTSAKCRVVLWVSPIKVLAVAVTALIKLVTMWPRIEKSSGADAVKSTKAG